ncbi:MAG: GntR family transcriptional regulator [Oscillospiraceae bacterium]|nr:GntR family transcriptional regulator [Oscillospiraceae bacterium]
MELIFDREEMNAPGSGARYKQIAKIISQNIANGNLAPNSQIPPEPQLMELFDCSRITVRAAIKELVEKGQLVRRQGLGTFVTETLKNLSVNDCSGFTADCIMDGHTPLTKVTSSGMKPVDDPDIAEFLGLKPGDDAFQVIRLRYVDGLPCAVEISFVSEEFDKLINADKTEWETSLYGLISKEYGISKIAGKRLYNACPPPTEVKELLELDSDNNVLVVDDLHWDANNKPIFSSTLYYKPSLFRLYSSFVSLL